MKYLAQAYIDGEYKNVEITDKDLKKYPKKYEAYTMYCPADDITIIWATEILITPKGEVELKRTIINFVYGSPSCDDMYDNHEYIERALNDYKNKGIVDLCQPLIVENNI